MTKKLPLYLALLLTTFLLPAPRLSSIVPTPETIPAPPSRQETDDTDEAFTLLERVIETNNFVSGLNDIYTVDFPIGIKANDSKEAENYAIIIPEMYIVDGEPMITAYMAFKVPGTTERIAFKGENISLSYSGGLSGIATLELVGDKEIALGRALTLTLKGGGATNVKWDCNGFVEMEITAGILFDNALFVPENEDGTIREEELKTGFHTVINDWNNLMIGVSLEPFQIRGLDGFGFSVTNAVFDMSDFRNPTGITFSPQYMADYLIDENANIWQGLYIQQAEIRFPPWFRQNGEAEGDGNAGATTTRLSVNARNMYVDELGFTGVIGASGLTTIDKGDLNGWGFSIENFNLRIETNSLVAAGFSGQIAVPQLGDNSLFGYIASIGLDATYSFIVTNTGTLRMDMWAADLEIDKNSFMKIELIDNEFIPTLILNGHISINSPVDKNDTTSTKLELAGLEFRDMVITTREPYFDIGYLSFGNQQSKFSMFPISITDIGLDSESDRRGINIGATVNFTGENDGSFGGAGIFTVWGRREGNKWVYDGVEVGGITVNIDKGEAFKLYGEVNFIRGDETYGNGFKGTVDASFAGFGMNSTALFGNMNGFRYFYADALLASTSGLPVGPIAIYGFGGGAYYHMRQSLPETPSASSTGSTASGISYLPDETAGLGLKASVRLGLSGNVNTFNGDAELGVDFNSGGGINKIAFRGNAYFATSNFSCETTDILQNARHIMSETGGGVKIPKNTNHSALSGDVEIIFDFPEKSFHSSFNLYANIAGGVITGTGPNGLAGSGVMHFSPGEWYLLLGTPENPNGIKVINIATFENYLMAGSDIPSIPSPPASVTNSLREHGLNYNTNRSDLELASGTGIAFGSKFSVDTGERSFLIFYGQFGCDIGFDIMLKNYKGTVCQGGSALGINGWYAQGQAYSWVKANMGIKIGLPFYSGTYEIFDMELATLMKAKAPNPVWLQGNVGGHYSLLNGLIKGSCSFDFEIGEQCIPTTTAELGDMSVIAELQPGEAEENVGVFTTPQVIFNMPVDKKIEIEAIASNNKIYRARLDDLSLRMEDGTGISGHIEWNSDKDVALFDPHEVLPGETKLIFKATVTFEEFKGNAWRPATNGGKAVTESREITFTTGKRPDNVPQENVAYSYPGYRAFNYYRGENNKGYVKLESSQQYLFMPGAEWKQLCRLINITTGTEQNISFGYDSPSATIMFTLPENMAGNNIYRIEIFNTPAVTSTVDNNVINDAEIVSVGDESYNTDVEIRKRYAEGERKELEETIIYSMEFRSSENDKLASKVANSESRDTYKLYNTYFTMRTEGEMFDSYELNGTSSRMVRGASLLESTPWYTQNIKPLLYMSNAEMSLIGVNPFKPSEQAVMLIKYNGKEVLSDSEIESGIVSSTNGAIIIYNYLFYECEKYYGDIRGRISNRYINNPGSVQGNHYRILNSTFVNPIHGNYPVSLNYYLPGQKEPESTTVVDMKW